MKFGAGKKRRGPRVCVIGIDGVPFTFLKKQFEQGRMNAFRSIVAQGDMKQMKTVLPPISSVAWASFQTGKNPGKHGIFGFVDRDPATMELKITTRLDLRARTISEILGDSGKHIVQMNVPCSYPPTPVNGKLISCFLATDINKATYPPEFATKLKELGYVIDVDPWKARQNLDAFLEDLFHALEMRLKTTLYLLKNEPWDFFISHIMETDRIGHFFWEYLETADARYTPRILDFFERVSEFIGAVADRLDGETHLVVLSDHGFCGLKKEVYVNNALADAGFLKLAGDEPKAPKDISPDSRAYSMIPGRFFVNLKGREKTGTVAPGAEYEGVRADLADFLMSLADPEDGSPIIRSVYKKEEIYSGSFFGEAADLIALPHDGYDLKGNLMAPSMFMKGALLGMHTDWDAALYIRGAKIGADNPHILDVMPSILSLFGLSTDGLDLDGQSIFQDIG
ncbi:MAG: alkaline phosphatase family protein [bacterium]